MEKYILILIDQTPLAHFIQKDTINEVYELIVSLNLPEGSYKIIKGNIIK